MNEAFLPLNDHVRRTALHSNICSSDHICGGAECRKVVQECRIEEIKLFLYVQVSFRVEISIERMSSSGSSSSSNNSFGNDQENTDRHSVPIMLFGRDPMFSSFRVCTIAQLHNPQVVSKVVKMDHIEFYYMKRPFQKVEVCGVLTKCKYTKRGITFALDDGTGSVECLKVTTNKRGYDDVLYEVLKIGNTILVRGEVESRISFFLPSMDFGEMNKEPKRVTIQATHVESIPDFNYELLHWERCIHLHKTVYSKEFVFQLNEEECKDFGFEMTKNGCCCGTSKIVKFNVMYCKCLGWHQYSSLQLPEGDSLDLDVGDLINRILEYMLENKIHSGFDVKLLLTFARGIGQDLNDESLARIFTIMEKMGLFVVQNNMLAVGAAGDDCKYLLATRESFFSPILRKSMMETCTKSPTNRGCNKTHTEKLHEVVNTLVSRFKYIPAWRWQFVDASLRGRIDIGAVKKTPS